MQLPQLPHVDNIRQFCEEGSSLQLPHRDATCTGNATHLSFKQVAAFALSLNLRVVFSDTKMPM